VCCRLGCCLVDLRGSSHEIVTRNELERLTQSGSSMPMFSVSRRPSSRRNAPQRAQRTRRGLGFGCDRSVLTMTQYRAPANQSWLGAVSTLLLVACRGEHCRSRKVVLQGDRSRSGHYRRLAHDARCCRWQSGDASLRSPTENRGNLCSPYSAFLKCKEEHGSLVIRGGDCATVRGYSQRQYWEIKCQPAHSRARSYIPGIDRTVGRGRDCKSPIRCDCSGP